MIFEKNSWWGGEGGSEGGTVVEDISKNI